MSVSKSRDFHRLVAETAHAPLREVGDPPVTVVATDHRGTRELVGAFASVDLPGTSARTRSVACPGRGDLTRAYAGEAGDGAA